MGKGKGPHTWNRIPKEGTTPWTLARSVRAGIPYRFSDEEGKLWDEVLGKMIHRPCGARDPGAVCCRNSRADTSSLGHTVYDKNCEFLGSELQDMLRFCPYFLSSADMTTTTVNF